MSFARRLLLPSSLVVITAVLIFSVSVGGCPQAQVPAQPAATEETPAQQAPESPTGGIVRPIPPPVQEETPPEEGGSTGQPPGQGGAGGGGSIIQPIAVVISSPAGADINILPGQEASISYEVFGGNPADGAIRVELYYDRDRMENTGDEVTLQTNLPARGTYAFAANLDPGVYYVALKAANTKESKTEYAEGRLVIVGEPQVTLILPATNQRVRPNAGVPVQFAIDSLATTVQYEVFTDTDLVHSGSEPIAFSGGGLSGNGTIYTDTLGAGSYYIGVQITDSTGQDKTLYLMGADGNPRIITVDMPPTVTVTEPTSELIIVAGQIVTVKLTATDPEANSAITAFRDPDGRFNGNEFVFATFNLTTPSGQFTANLDTKGVPPATYRLGATISDGVGEPIVSYAQGSFRINAAPTLTITAPVTDVTIYRGDSVTVEWTADDFEKNVKEVSLLAAKDDDADGQPDPGTIQVVQSGFQLGKQSFTRTIPYVDEQGIPIPPGRYLAGVRVVDDLDTTVEKWASGVIHLENAPPSVTIYAPLVNLTLHTGDQTQLRWTSSDQENRMENVSVVLARDDNGDGQPDPGTTQVLESGFYAGTISYTFDTAPAGMPPVQPGRYLLGVRAVDDEGSTVTVFAPGAVTVVNDPPTILLTQPSGAAKVRPGTPVAMAFRVDDTEHNLKPQPTGIQIVVARDNGLGIPDGDPIYFESSPDFHRGDNTYTFNTAVLVSFLPVFPPDPEPGRFLLGVRAEDELGALTIVWAPGGLTIDSVVPTIALLEPTDNLRKDRVDTLTVKVKTSDTSPTQMRVLLDKNSIPLEGDEYELIPSTPVDAGIDQEFTFTFNVSDIPAGLYNYYLVIADGVGQTAFYATNLGTPITLLVRGRMLGTYHVSVLDTPVLEPDEPLDGAVLQGFNFNDLAGTSMTSVKDVNGDNLNEVLIGSRFGKPFNAFAPNNGVGFGEAYLFYGQASRLRAKHPLNSAGASVPGLIFPGIRTPRNVPGPLSRDYESTGWTAGLSDITVIDDMDGDGLPELVFSFPRVESITLGLTHWRYQLPELVPDLPGMGDLELDASGTPPAWTADVAQFTRGGFVIVSSHDPMLQDSTLLNRKGDRVVDLHEVGQLFNSMSRPSLVPYIKQITEITDPPGGNPPHSYDCLDCDLDPATGGCQGGTAAQEATVRAWQLAWDAVFNNQAPGGFLRENSFINVNPPLANVSIFTPMLDPVMFTFYPPNTPVDGNCPLMFGNIACRIQNVWYTWGNCMGQVPFPGGDSGTCALPSWGVPGLIPTSMWTGFYGPQSFPVVFYDTGESFWAPIGARVVGQKVDDLFGTALGFDGTWLYISAPDRTANDAPYGSDIGGMVGSRTDAGVVYQLRTTSKYDISGPTRTQLWIEPGQVYPTPDTELQTRTDYSMPVPHTYIIEIVGSLRCPPNPEALGNGVQGGCPPPWDPGEGTQADNSNIYLQGSPSPPGGPPTQTFQYPVGTSGFYMDQVYQMAGPHAGAKIKFVRGIGDLNGDGIRDFAVGSEFVKQTVVNPGIPPNPPAVNWTGPQVGSVFIVFGRPPGLQGDLMLEKLALDPTDPSRLKGVLVQGESSGETLARVFADAGNIDGTDANGDAFDDVIIGNEGKDVGGLVDAGEAIVLLGSRDLSSPAGGWRPSTIPTNPALAIHFVGANAGDRVGANVSSAGDVDADGYSDLLIAAPAYDSNRGAVYLIYGGPHLTQLPQPIVLSPTTVGTVELPGATFLGRNQGDFLGGGTKTVANTAATPTSPGYTTTVYSQGVTALGDLDGDGWKDFAISAMLANPNGNVDGGEVYVIYGEGP